MMQTTENRTVVAQQLLADLKALYTALPLKQQEAVQITLQTHAFYEKART